MIMMKQKQMNRKAFIKLTGLGLSTMVGGCVNIFKDNPAQRSNILFAISDDQSYLHTSFAGCKFVNTPAFDRIAAEGVYFTNCYAGSPGCAPSRSSLITGRHHWQNEQSGQHWSPWLKKYVPFVDELEANGYSVGRTGKGVGPFQYARNENDSLWRKENAAGPEFSNITYDETNDERSASGIKTINYAENFKYFIDNVKGDKPFFLWYGTKEPHRSFEKDSWKKHGKKLEDADVPDFLPDNPTVRGDLLDYAVEIEWFDLHLQKMLEYLEEIGELDNTIVIVTSDNGMFFPRAKANCYEYGIHVPLAIRYPKAIQGGRISETLVSFIDLAPTILEAMETKPENMMPITGESIWNLLTSNNEDNTRTVFSGRERHSSSRYLNWGYPQRSIRKGDYLYIWNAIPERWPAGAPQGYDEKDSTLLRPLYGLTENEEEIGKGVFADIDNSPTKRYIIKNHNNKETAKYFYLACDKRPEFELYNIEKDSGCLDNLSGIPEFKTVEEELKEILFNELKRTKDTRISETDFDTFDSYKRYYKMRKFPKPTEATLEKL
jgi:N-sulfoglucosamine sulfohydrolase